MIQKTVAEIIVQDVMLSAIKMVMVECLILVIVDVDENNIDTKIA